MSVFRHVFCGDAVFVIFFRGVAVCESGIHRVESRIQDGHGFPYMGRNKISVLMISMSRIKKELRLD